jgi:hypothetical protein
LLQQATLIVTQLWHWLLLLLLLLLLRLLLLSASSRWLLCQQPAAAAAAWRCIISRWRRWRQLCWLHVTATM